MSLTTMAIIGFIAFVGLLVFLVATWKPGSASDLAREIAQEFRTGRVIDSDISPHSISEISVRYLGNEVAVTWYPLGERSGRLRTLTVGGTKGVFPNGADYNLIFEAALDRAYRLIDERMALLESERAKARSSEG